ncbi:hypothetical protein SMSP2_01105 [Limihaloglobus sulfuriphilus]|uniref:Uncharacterized protein n=1 Tax=Limihaloglobus sulfuriphilus TaxID=1851148 RepID=A0A1Q2MDM8_9BACT|nr:hypothetical protein [Limihaloglobus sulfuriphilus]AQQ70744.1 hypothetical protein SMSP2_01105 [Limihaloglobus sulfuriphilus]
MDFKEEKIQRTFKCPKCGSNKLGYQNYVKSLTPVNINNEGHIHYGESVIDHDDQIPAEYGYICQHCESKLTHAGEWLETESELIHYLNLSQEQLDREQKQFEVYIEEQAQEQKDRDEERHLCYEECCS